MILDIFSIILALIARIFNKEKHSLIEKFTIDRYLDYQKLSDDISSEPLYVLSDKATINNMISKKSSTDK